MAIAMAVVLMTTVLARIMATRMITTLALALVALRTWMLTAYDGSADDAADGGMRTRARSIMMIGLCDDEFVVGVVASECGGGVVDAGST